MCCAQVMDKHGEAHASIFSRGETGRLNSLSVVLSQEIDRFNRLTKQMQSSLKELQKAIKGIVVMSDELEQMLHSMLDSKVCRHTVCQPGNSPPLLNRGDYNIHTSHGMVNWYSAQK